MLMPASGNMRADRPRTDTARAASPPRVLGEEEPAPDQRGDVLAVERPREPGVVLPGDRHVGQRECFRGGAGWCYSRLAHRLLPSQGAGVHGPQPGAVSAAPGRLVSPT